PTASPTRATPPDAVVVVGPYVERNTSRIIPMKILSQPPKLMGTGLKRAGVAKKINNLSDFRGPESHPENVKRCGRARPLIITCGLAVAVSANQKRVFGYWVFPPHGGPFGVFMFPPAHTWDVHGPRFLRAHTS